MNTSVDLGDGPGHKGVTDELFEPCTWEEFHDWRVCAWEIPTSVVCIMRAEHKDTAICSLTQPMS